MFPYFTLFGRQISTYAICAVIGILVAGFFYCRQVKKRGCDENDGIILMLIIGAASFIFSHIMYAITNIVHIPQLFGEVKDFGSLWNALVQLFGGSVFYGGLLGGIATGLVCLRLMKLNKTVYSDCAAPMIPLFHGFARIGCFFGGCCYGISCDFGFTAHRNTLVPELNDVSRFPVQLLEAACNFILFFVLRYLLKRNILRGRLLCIYLLAYAAIRFADEFLRGDLIRGSLFGLSTSQFISLLTVVAAVIWLIVIQKKKRINAEN